LNGKATPQEKERKRDQKRAEAPSSFEEKHDRGGVSLLPPPHLATAEERERESWR